MRESFLCDVARLLVNTLLSCVRVTWSIFKHDRASELRERQVWLPIELRLLNWNVGFYTKDLLQLKERSPDVDHLTER